MRILIVDDEPVALDSVKRILKRRGLKDVEVCGNGADAIETIKDEDFDIVLLDLLMPDVDGLAVLQATKPFRPSTEFIILTAVDDLSMAVSAVRLGAYDYLVKPVDNNRLFLSVERAYERKGLIAGLAGTHSAADNEETIEAFPDIITQDPRMKELLSYTLIMARGGNPILVTGESGTGKELLARGIHRAGPAPGGPFTAVNVSSIPETLFESQFFGHVKGAFTGADKNYTGYFEQANGGTLFLDEIGELPPNLQVKLLRALEEKAFTRLGETKPINVDVRIVSATNTDLGKSCRQGKFRLDLMYRLKSAQIHLPPMREREGDIPLLADHFLKQAAKRHQKDVRGFSPEALDILIDRDFPGNIRELAHTVENAALLAQSGMILPHHLGESARPATPSFRRGPCTLKENDDAHIVYVLTHTEGDRQQAAGILGVTVRQVQRRLSELRTDPRWKSLLRDL